MQTALAELESTYLTLQSQIGMLLAACQTQDQRDALTSQYVAARSSYWTCVNKAFHDDDPTVIALTTQLDAANNQVKAAVQQLGDIATAIKTITQAVTVGASLAAKVIAV
jgi:ABC-type proline/glycine betaine transport system substrate-binding protein